MRMQIFCRPKVWASFLLLGALLSPRFSFAITSCKDGLSIQHINEVIEFLLGDHAKHLSAKERKTMAEELSENFQKDPESDAMDMRMNQKFGNSGVNDTEWTKLNTKKYAWWSLPDFSAFMQSEIYKEQGFVPTDRTSAHGQAQNFEEVLRAANPIDAEKATRLLNAFRHPALPSEPVKNQPQRKNGFDELLTPDLLKEYKEETLDPVDLIPQAREAREYAVEIHGPEVFQEIPKGVTLAYFLSAKKFLTMKVGQLGSNADVQDGTEAAKHLLPLDFVHIGLGKLKTALSTGNLRFDDIPQGEGKKPKLRLTLDNAAGTYQQKELSRYIYVITKLFELNIVPDEIVLRQVQRNSAITTVGDFSINP